MGKDFIGFTEEILEVIQCCTPYSNRLCVVLRFPGVKLPPSVKTDSLDNKKLFRTQSKNVYYLVKKTDVA